MTVNIPVSYGDFFDRLTILEIKAERITDDDKLEIVNEMLAEFRAIAFVSAPIDGKISGFVEELRQVNTTIWDIENDIREYQRKEDFGTDFVSALRTLHKHKDRRAELKREIDTALGSNMTDVKDYKST